MRPVLGGEVAVLICCTARRPSWATTSRQR